jgi:hypothetical protein
MMALGRSRLKAAFSLQRSAFKISEWRVTRTEPGASFPQRAFGGVGGAKGF